MEQFKILDVNDPYGEPVYAADTLKEIVEHAKEKLPTGGEGYDVQDSEDRKVELSEILDAYKNGLEPEDFEDIDTI